MATLRISTIYPKLVISQSSLIILFLSMLKSQSFKSKPQIKLLSPTTTKKSQSSFKLATIKTSRPIRGFKTRFSKKTIQSSTRFIASASFSSPPAANDDDLASETFEQFSHVPIPPGFVTKTDKARFLWMRNKLRPAITQTLQYYLTQYDIIPLPTIDTQNSTIPSSEEAIFQGLLAHELLVPVDSPAHPYDPLAAPEQFNKQKLTSNIVQTLVELDIVPKDYATKYKLGTIPPVSFPGGHRTDTRQLTNFHTDSNTPLITIADMFNLAIISSGAFDLPQSTEYIKAPPQGESYLTNFNSNVIKFFKPDNKEDEFTPLRKQLGQIQAQVDAAQGPEVLDDFMRDYHRNDVTQQYITTYGGKIPNLEVYKAFLFQQVAQTLLVEHYLYQPKQTICHHTIAQHPRDLKEHREELSKMQTRHDRETFLTVQDALPNNAYPVMDLVGKHLPMPPNNFAGAPHNTTLVRTLPRKHLSSQLQQFQSEPSINTTYTSQNQAEEEAFLSNPLVKQFSSLFEQNQPIATLRHIFLKQFRHDLTVFHNMVSNPILQKFKTDFEDELWTKDQKDQMINIISDLHFQNILDNEFKEQYHKYTTNSSNPPQHSLVELDFNPDAVTPEVNQEPIYRHLLADKYPAFAQKCHSLLRNECNEQAETNKKQHIANSIAQALGGTAHIQTQ